MRERYLDGSAGNLPLSGRDQRFDSHDLRPVAIELLRLSFFFFSRGGGGGQVSPISELPAAAWAAPKRMEDTYCSQY